MTGGGSAMRQFSGKLLRKIREGKGQKYSQGQLAFELGKWLNQPVSQGSVSDWENEAYSPSSNNLAALSDVLGCEMADFFTGDGSINACTATARKSKKQKRE
jgi:transcriptional regulator with XRE-family HTH domain